MVVQDHARNLACRVCGEEWQPRPPFWSGWWVARPQPMRWRWSRGVDWTTIVRHAARRADQRPDGRPRPRPRRPLERANRPPRARERDGPPGECGGRRERRLLRPERRPCGRPRDRRRAPERARGRPVSAPAVRAVAPPLIAPVRYRGRITVNGRSREIDGIDRTRGLIPACGGRGGDVPTIRPNAVLTCIDSSELVVLSPRYGARPPAEGGVEAIVRDGIVTRVRPPGVGGVPREGVLLTGHRRRRSFPAQHGASQEQGGRAAGHLSWGVSPSTCEGLTVVGGGPRILRAGRVAVAARAEGFAPVLSFFRSFVAGRQPRTLAGRAGGWDVAPRDGRRQGSGLERGHDAAGGRPPDALARRPRCPEPGRRRLVDDDRARRGREPALRPMSSAA